MWIRRSPALLCALFLLAASVTGCAASGPRASSQLAANGEAADGSSNDAGSNDPWESTNRDIFTFNQSVDRNVLVPVAETYRKVVPEPARDSLHNFLVNLNSPVTFANDVLQAQPELAAKTLGRFVVNSTIGFGGLIDVATPGGIPYHPNDLGITMATYGVPDGGYLVIPVLGPSSPRDLAGQIGDGFADPANIVAGQYHLLYATILRTATEGIDQRSRNIETLADIEKTSLDYYATIRSLYRQRRAAQIRHEQTNLPNVSPVQGGDAGPAMNYTFQK